MPRTIEHKIKLLDRPATPPTSPTESITAADFGGPLEYGTINRAKNFPSLRRTAPSQVEEGPVEKEKGDYWPKMGNENSSGRSQSSHQMMQKNVAPEKPARKYHHFESKKQDDEVTYGTEIFERNLRYSPHEIERQHFSSRSFGEQRSLGGDGESRTSVRFEDDSPVRPIDPNYDNPNPFAHRTHRSISDEDDAGGGGEREGREGVRLLHRSKHLDTSPLRIPRPKLNGGAPPQSPIHSSKRNDIGHSPQIHDQYSQRPVRVLPPPLSFTNSSTTITHSPIRHSRQSWRTKTQQHSPSSGLGHSPSEATKSSSSPERGGIRLDERKEKDGNGNYAPPNMPMKKVIRKSRWISIHDGKPMSQFVETVHYEPAYGTATAGTHYGPHPSGHNSTLHRCPAEADLWSSSSSCSLSSAGDEAEIGNNDKKWTKQKNSKRLNRNQESTPQQSARPKTHQSSKSTVYVTQNPVYSIAL